VPGGNCPSPTGTSGADRRDAEALDTAAPDLSAREVALDGHDDAPADAGGADAACRMQVPGCAPGAGTCDPVCQTGCKCGEKCSVSSAGALTCNAPAGSTRLREGESCDLVSGGTSLQTDACAPGLVCAQGACRNRCARHCRTDADCPASTCSVQLAPGFKVCDVPAADCNPLRSLGPTGCAAAAEGCYLALTVKDGRFCDCPTSALPEGGPCRASRECLPGLACVDALGTTDFRCRVVCDLAGAVSGCTAGASCRPLNGSTQYGYCRI
jgi:hypothetical protein